MNDHEIERIAAAFHALRPDWPASSLRTMLTKRAAAMPRRDVCVMLAWIACDTASSTPARMFETGPWKRAAAVEGSTVPSNVRPSEACDICGQAEVYPLHVVDHDWQRPRERQANASQHVDHLRALMRGGDRDE